LSQRNKNQTTLVADSHHDKSPLGANGGKSQQEDETQEKCLYEKHRCGHQNLLGSEFVDHKSNSEVNEEGQRSINDEPFRIVLQEITSRCAICQEEQYGVFVEILLGEVHTIQEAKLKDSGKWKNWRFTQTTKAHLNSQNNEWTSNRTARTITSKAMR